MPKNRANVKIKNGPQRSTQKTQKNILIILLNFYITFLATWGCAIDFLKMLPLPEFKMAARGQLQKKICVRKNSKFF